MIWIGALALLVSFRYLDGFAVQAFLFWYVCIVKHGVLIRLPLSIRDKNQNATILQLFYQAYRLQLLRQ